MQTRLKLPFTHDIRYAQHYRCQASEVELFVKTVNDLKPLKAVIAKRSILDIWRGSEYASTFLKLNIWKGEVLGVDPLHKKTVLNFWLISFYFFNISVKYYFWTFSYLNCCKLFEVFNPKINKAIIITLQ